MQTQRSHSPLLLLAQQQGGRGKCSGSTRQKGGKSGGLDFDLHDGGTSDEGFHNKRGSFVCSSCAEPIDSLVP